MAIFVLVHGAWQSAATWDLLTPLLEARGHQVIAPILTGLGADQDRLSPVVSLATHIEDVSSELSRLPEPAILCGHSYAGMIISGVAATMAHHIRRLVYLDAFIPEGGQCVLDLLPPLASRTCKPSM